MRYLELLLLCTSIVFQIFAVSAYNSGNWNEAMSVVHNKKVQELGKWVLPELPEYTGLKGEHVIMNVRNIYTQAVSGVNYKFTLEILVDGSEVIFFMIKKNFRKKKQFSLILFYSLK